MPDSYDFQSRTVLRNSTIWKYTDIIQSGSISPMHSFCRIFFCFAFWQNIDFDVSN